MGILHCIENNIPYNHMHMLLYVYHHAIMLVNPDIQLIGKMHKLGYYFFFDFTKNLPQNICVGLSIEKKD